MTTHHQKEDDDDRGSLSIEEIAAEANTHRPHLPRPGTPPFLQLVKDATESPAAARLLKKDLPIKTKMDPFHMQRKNQHHHQQQQKQDEDLPHNVLDEHDDYDDDLLHRAVADAGRWAYGAVLVEVWVMHRTKLIRPTSGWWLDPVYHVQPCNEAICQLCRLTDPTRSDYVPSAALIPGEGLPGVLWAELADSNPGKNHVVLANNDQNTYSSNVTNAGFFGRILQQHHHDKYPLDDSIGGSSGRRSTNKSPKFWSSSYNASFRSGGGGGGNGPYLESSGKGRGHRRAVTSADDFVSAIAIGSTDVTGEQVDQRPKLFPGQQSRIKLTVGIDDAVVGTAKDDKEQRGEFEEVPVVQPSVAWRDVKSLAADPDQPWNPRLQLLSSCNLGWAAAVPLRRLDHAAYGLVIYMARSDVDASRLRSTVNEAYLTSAAELIGSTLLLRGPRRAAVQARDAELSLSLKKVRRRIIFILRSGRTLQDIVNGTCTAGTTHVAHDSINNVNPDSIQTIGYYNLFQNPSVWAVYLTQKLLWIKRKLVTTLAKTKGGAVQAPPSFSWRQTFVTFVGVFLTLSAMAWLNTRLVENHGGDATLLLGPFGALATLLYGLTAAPASQPRNAILGQVVAIGVVLLLAYIPHWEDMSLEWRAVLSTSTAISAMVRLGLTHPPAGASALLFALGPDRWEASHLAVLLLAYFIAIGMATFLNNLSDRRQYPTFWGLAPFPSGIAPHG